MTHLLDSGGLENLVEHLVFSSLFCDCLKMPKVKGKAENGMRKYVAEFSNVSSTDGTVLFFLPALWKIHCSRAATSYSVFKQ